MEVENEVGLDLGDKISALGYADSLNMPESSKEKVIRKVNTLIEGGRG